MTRLCKNVIWYCESTLFRNIGACLARFISTVRKLITPTIITHNTYLSIYLPTYIPNYYLTYTNAVQNPQKHLQPMQPFPHEPYMHNMRNQPSDPSFLKQTTISAFKARLVITISPRIYPFLSRPAKHYHRIKRLELFIYLPINDPYLSLLLPTTFVIHLSIRSSVLLSVRSIPSHLSYQPSPVLHSFPPHPPSIIISFQRCSTVRGTARSRLKDFFAKTGILTERWYIKPIFHLRARL